MENEYHVCDYTDSETGERHNTFEEIEQTCNDDTFEFDLEDL
jgi:hypothetical protein